MVETIVGKGKVGSLINGKFTIECFTLICIQELACALTPFFYERYGSLVKVIITDVMSYGENILLRGNLFLLL